MGLYKKYTERGVVLEESNYKNDQYEGKAIFRDVFGNIVSQGMFVQGKKAGMWQFFEKGKLVKETNMSALPKMDKSQNKLTPFSAIGVLNVFVPLHPCKILIFPK